MRRYRTWDDVEPPRSNDAIVEMMFYRRFHYENMADHLGWIADLIDRLDGRHEQRSHGGSYPRPLDEIVSPYIDSWGLSHHSADRLTSEDPYSLASECFGFQWCRTAGRNNRWWNEEIYGSFVGGLAPREKMTIPEESAAFLWLTLIEGAAGAMFWQYRPEYMTFESPGLSIVGLDGEPTARWPAIKRAIAEIDSIGPHLPISIPRAELAIAYSGLSHEVFDYGHQNTLFLQQLRGMYRTLWSHSIAMDIITPAMDWSAFKAIYLPNFALLDDVAITRIRDVLQDATGPTLIADGPFGTFAGKGHWSFHPPEGLTDVIDARIVDFDSIKERDILARKSILVTDFGEYPIARPCQYAILEPRGDMRPIATLGDDVVAVRSADGRFTWFGLSLSATASTNVPGQPAAPPPAGIVHAELALALVQGAGVESHFTIEGDPIVAFRRGSKLGGSLVFLLNVERRTAHTSIRPRWPVVSARDLLDERDLALHDHALEVEMAFGTIRVIHCADGST